jgi:hypothetical protein
MQKRHQLIQISSKCSCNALRFTISEEGVEAESNASLESRRIKNHGREEKQVLHAPR